MYLYGTARGEADWSVMVYRYYCTRDVIPVIIISSHTAKAKASHLDDILMLTKATS